MSGEALLVEIWRRRWLVPGVLVDSFGRELRVVYPGRRWGGPGPDFQGAVLALSDGSLLRGDVEVHLAAADWRAHGHQRDPAYNRTVLHVVLRAGRGEPTRRQDGVEIALVELAHYLAEPLPALAERLAAGRPPPVELACLDSAAELIEVVDQAGRERFFEKAASFEADLAALGPDESFYRGFLVALGYSANKVACARLAELVPWGLVGRVGRGAGGQGRLRALLLGGAGLLPSQRGLKLVESSTEGVALEADWRELAPELGRRPLPATAWRVAGVRPENSPARRLAGGAGLLAAWAADGGPAGMIEEMLSERRERPGQLAELFRFAADGFWAWHYDFGVPTAGRRPWLIGRPRAQEIVVNVLLPCGYALGRAEARDELSAAALLAFQRLPAGPWNRLSLAMAAQLFGAAGAHLCSPAARQQGLLQLYKRWCWERRCERCLAGGGRRAAGIVAMA